MLNTVFKISERLQGSAFVTWTAPIATHVSWVFVNGILIAGPIFTGTTARSTTIRFSKDLNKVIEIHDFPDATITPDVVTVKQNDRPSIEWNRNAAAIKYKIFHTPDGQAEKLISTTPVIDDRERYNLKSPVRLVEGWHFFRVESVNKFGIESTTTLWRFRAFRIPKPVAGLTVANGSGSGLFNITIS